MKNILTGKKVEEVLQKLGNREKVATYQWFFKTGKGQYGEGDVFLGISVPDQRKVAREHWDLSLPEVAKLLASPIHECRLTALHILVAKYTRGDKEIREKVAKFYLKHTKKVNNWDLVDSSAPYILGAYLLDKDRAVLCTLAVSKNLWERRIAIVSTFAFIRAGEYTDTFALAELLLDDTHDLIHKATGWMLREVGKRVSTGELVTFINTHKKQMPRTTLRYAIEHFPPEIRTEFLK